MSLLTQLSQARVYDLARPLEAATPNAPTAPPFQHALLRRHGDFVEEDGRSVATDFLIMGGHTGTHIDALCHVAHDGRLHGGADALEAAVGGRFKVGGVEEIEPIICRGVLLDVPGAKGVDSLGPGEAVTGDDLVAAEKHCGVEVRAGDAVLVRTGWPRGRYHDRAAYWGASTGVPGPDESAARWLAVRKIHLTGDDTIAYEWMPAGKGLATMPVHVLLLVQEGIPIIEMIDLEELAADRVYEFVFIATPLRITGATGSPIRPIAIAGGSG